MNTASGRSSILLVGAGGHARSVIDVIEQCGRLTIAGVIGLEHEVGGTCLGYRILGSDAALDRLLDQHHGGLVTVGQIKSPEIRMRLFGEICRRHREIPAIISPLAHVSAHAQIGDGSIVMHGAVINAGAVVGRNCIINTHALIEHDVEVADHCHVATGALVNSGVRIGVGSFVGSGAVIRQGISLGERCVIGMGQRVLRDCDALSWVPEKARRA